ncbi:MAG: PspC domain-containing protein [Rikenellaceae bacterium]|nr:PspC domain-containing protein [Rikenellaceae bacterium]
MKQTINANIGSLAFTVDEDAYRLLERYLSDISSRLDSTNLHILEDVEARIADLLKEEIASPMQVVTAEMARRVTARIGRPEEFGDRKTTFGDTAGDGFERSSETTRQRLSRPQNDRMIAGVCSGVARYFEVDPTLIRVIAILAVILGTAGLWIYIILWICMPDEKEVVQYPNRNERR